MDNKIIYTKYSNDRKDIFCIKTVIINKAGKLFVRKYSMEKKGNKHIQNIYRNGVILKDYFKNTNFIVQNTILKENYLEYEFINGSTLEEKLLNLLKKGNCDLIKEFLLKFYKELLKLETIDHISSNEFKSVFGDIEFNTPQKSFLISNIDLTFNNIIINDDKWSIIDYEWTFNFTIPIKYIIFRILLNYKDLNKYEYYNLFDISKEEIAIFHKMEEAFLTYVGYNKYVGCFKKKRKIDVFGLLSECKELKSEVEESSYIINMLREDIEQQDARVGMLKNSIEQRDSTIDILKESIAQKEKTIDVLKINIEQLNNSINEYKKLVFDYENSTSWKITAPIRSFTKYIK